MPGGRKVSPEQIIVMLRQIEVQLAQRKSPTQACKEAGISEQSYYRCAGSMGACSLSEQSA
jgi:putative transposase